MFGKKVSETGRLERPLVNHEQAMLEYAHKMSDFRRKASAVVINLSRAAGFGYDNYLYAINMFKALVMRFNGSLFILSNRDLVFAYHGPPGEPAVKDAIFKIRLLFDVPGGEGAGDDFATWFDLEMDHREFVAYAERMLEEKRQAAMVAEKPAAAQAAEPLPPREGERFGLGALDRFVAMVSEIDLSPLLRRQPICRVAPDKPPAVMLHEIYVSIADLERKLMPGIRLMADRHLFRYLTHVLDKRVLKLIKHQIEVLPAASFSLNVNVATLLSPEFEAFDAALPAEMRKNIVLELPGVDVLADLTAFLAVRDRTRERGYRLCLDGLSVLTLPYIRLKALGFDLYKIGWSRDLVDLHDSGDRSLLHGIVENCGADRMILCHCDSEDAVRIGSDFGIRMFQGRYVDGLLKNPSP